MALCETKGMFIKMDEKSNAQQIGNAVYVVERVFCGEKTAQQIVTEEIISTAKSNPTFDHSGTHMI